MAYLYAVCFSESTIHSGEVIKNIILRLRSNIFSPYESDEDPFMRDVIMNNTG
jgi:hypothetical protein